MIVLIQSRVNEQTLTNFYFTPSRLRNVITYCLYFCTNNRSNLFIIVSFATFFLYSSELYNNKIATFEENPFLSLTVTSGVL